MCFKRKMLNFMMKDIHLYAELVGNSFISPNKCHCKYRGIALHLQKIGHEGNFWYKKTARKYFLFEASDSEEWLNQNKVRVFESFGHSIYYQKCKCRLIYLHSKITMTHNMVPYLRIYCTCTYTEVTAPLRYFYLYRVVPTQLLCWSICVGTPR